MVSKSFDFNTSKISPFEPATRKLILEVYPGALNVILWNKEGDCPEACEIFSGANAETGDWDAIVQQSRLLGLKDLETEIISAYPRMIPVPGFLYTPAVAKDHLLLMFGHDGGLHTGGDVLKDHSMVITWQMPAVAQQLFRDHFQVSRTEHLVSRMINKFSGEAGVKSNLVVYGTLAWVTLWQDKQLLIAKSIGISQPDDLSYHLLNTCRQFKIDPAETSWEVSGMVEENSPLMNAVTRFFERVILKTSNGVVPEGLQGHYFAHLGGNQVNMSVGQ